MLDLLHCQRIIELCVKFDCLFLTETLLFSKITIRHSFTGDSNYNKFVIFMKNLYYCKGHGSKLIITSFAPVRGLFSRNHESSPIP